MEGKYKTEKAKNEELEEENRKLKSEIENMKKVGRENIETLDRMSIELENYSESFKRYRDFSKQELADSLYDSEEQNKKLKERIRFLEQCLDNKEKVNKSMRDEIRNLKEELGKITVHSNMLESENILLKKECKARLERIKELEK